MPDPIDGFLAVYDEDVQNLARGARELIRRLAPDTKEKLFRGWKTIGYSRGHSIIAIGPHKSWVNLQFHNGANLPDPAGLMEGTGKRMRHVKVKTLDDLEQPALAKLIREASKLAE